MASSTFPTPYADKQTSTLVASKTSSVPWYIWWGALAVTSASIGGAWDVSWHRSIGRDSFWTAAHMAIYACGVLAAIICGYLMLVTGRPGVRQQTALKTTDRDVGSG